MVTLRWFSPSVSLSMAGNMAGFEAGTRKIQKQIHHYNIEQGSHNHNIIGTAQFNNAQYHKHDLITST